MAKKNCPKCHGTGFVKEKDGTVHTCWDCLEEGELDVHVTEIKDTNVKW